MVEVRQGRCWSRGGGGCNRIGSGIASGGHVMGGGGSSGEGPQASGILMCSLPSLGRGHCDPLPQPPVPQRSQASLQLRGRGPEAAHM